MNDSFCWLQEKILYLPEIYELRTDYKTHLVSTRCRDVTWACQIAGVKIQTFCSKKNIPLYVCFYV